MLFDQGSWWHWPVNAAATTQAYCEISGRIGVRIRKNGDRRLPHVPGVASEGRHWLDPQVWEGVNSKEFLLLTKTCTKSEFSWGHLGTLRWASRVYSLFKPRPYFDSWWILKLCTSEHWQVHKCLKKVFLTIILDSNSFDSILFLTFQPA